MTSGFIIFTIGILLKIRKNLRTVVFLFGMMLERLKLNKYF
jgi:hypothetical protein